MIDSGGEMFYLVAVVDAVIDAGGELFCLIVVVDGVFDVIGCLTQWH